VSVVAKELNVSPQAVYKRLNNGLNGLNNGLNGLNKHVHKDKQGKKVIDTEGVELLRQSFVSTSSTTSSTTVQQPFKQPFKQDIDDILLEQVREKDKQINELLRQNESLINKLENMQILIKNEQEKTRLLITDEVQEEKGFFKRWFK